MTVILRKPDAITKVTFYKKVVSTVFTFNDIVYVDGSGFLTPAVDGIALVPVGLILKAIASTDSDYADATRVPVLVPGPEAEFICDVSTGSAAQTDVGEWIDIDDANSVDVTASTYDIFFVTGIISATQVIAKMARKSGAAA